MENVSQFFTHGFAIYVRWEGGRGVDQFGDIWTIRKGYALQESGVYKFKMTEV